MILTNGRYDNTTIEALTATKKVVNVEHSTIDRLRPYNKSSK